MPEVKDSPEPHIHQWESYGGFGVIVGIARCKTCHKVSRVSDFEVYRKEAQRLDEEAQCQK